MLSAPVASGRSCDDEGWDVNEGVPKEVAGMGEAPGALEEVGGWTRLRMEVRTGIVSSMAGERFSERVVGWDDDEGLVGCEALGAEEKEGEVDMA